MIEAGIDEAGRGSAIGPLVVACVVLEEEGLKVLRGLVKDSKKLSPSMRSRLYPLVLRAAVEVRVEIVGAEEVDWAVENLERGLNELEAMVAAELVDKLLSPVSRVYIDSPDPVPGRYAELVKGYLNRSVEVVASNKAEDSYLHVAAASIIAKVERDERIESLKREYGDFGSGYPSDPKTRRFLSECLRGERKMPPVVRRSWGTLLKL